MPQPAVGSRSPPMTSAWSRRLRSAPPPVSSGGEQWPRTNEPRTLRRLSRLLRRLSRLLRRLSQHCTA
jgi:hypothetical protein